MSGGGQDRESAGGRARKQNQISPAQMTGAARTQAMNRNTQMPMGDLSGTETELNVPTEEVITQRAREIALINERSANDFTKEDWEQARRELTGVETNPRLEDPLELAALSSERGSVPGQTGSRAPRVTPRWQSPPA